MTKTSKQWPLEVTGKAEQGAHVALSVGGHTLHTDEPPLRGGTDAGPAPFATFIASLVGCSHATLKLISREQGVTFSEVSYRLRTQIDPRGAFGVVEVTHPVENIQLDVTCKTDATDAQLEAISNELPKRCMVSVVMKQAGIRVHHAWHPKPL